MAMFRINAKKRARILTKAEFKRMLKVCTITREATRNQLIFCLSHACGLRVTELASIRDIMLIGGSIKTELTLRSSYTKNAHARTVPMPDGTLTVHLELYLAYRIEHGIGLSGNPAEFRGLLPDLPLVFSSRGSGFALASKKRVLESGAHEVYLAADALEQLFRDLYQMGGLKGASSHSGRRSYATRLVESGVDIEDVSRLLGHTIWTLRASMLSRRKPTSGRLSRWPCNWIQAALLWYAMRTLWNLNRHAGSDSTRISQYRQGRAGESLSQDHLG